jgi:hypothetical protein
MPRQEAAHGGRAIRGAHLSGYGHPPAGQGIAETIRTIEQDGCAGIRLQVAGMLGQAGDQQDRRAVRLGCYQNERRVWMPGITVEGGQGRLQGRTDELPGSRARVDLRGQRRLSLGFGSHAHVHLGVCLLVCEVAIIE